MLSSARRHRVKSWRPGCGQLTEAVTLGAGVNFGVGQVSPRFRAIASVLFAIRGR
jgi:hypothetical protein